MAALEQLTAKTVTSAMKLTNSTRKDYQMEQQVDDDRWFKQAPWPERFEAGWNNMSKEHKREFLAESWQQHLKEQYEMALAFYSVEGAPWEELSQDQKDSVEFTVKQNAQDMQAFGKTLSE